MDFCDNETIKRIKAKNIINISEFNDYLIKKGYKLMIIDYIKVVHYKFNNTIDLTFMSYFMDFIDKKDEFCIDARMYYVFKTIITKNLNNDEIDDKDKNIENYKQTSKDIKISLHRSNLIENDDYSLLGHVPQQSNTSRGLKYKNIYMLKPKAFKKLLLDIHEHNVRIVFIDYYLFLEDCIKNYDDYQFKLQEKYTTNLLSVKDDKIDEQSKKLDEIIAINKEQTVKIDKQNTKIDKQDIKINKLLNYGKNITKDVKTIKRNVINMNTRFSTIFPHTGDNILKSKCIKVYEIIKDDPKYRYLTISYCSIEGIDQSIISKLRYHKLYYITKEEVDVYNSKTKEFEIELVDKYNYLFNKINLVWVSNSINDSMFATSNISNLLKAYCKEINKSYPKDESKYISKTRTVKIRKSRFNTVNNKIVKFYENTIAEMIDEINNNENDLRLISKLQAGYKNETIYVINDIIDNSNVGSSSKVLKRVKKNILDLYKSDDETESDSE